MKICLAYFGYSARNRCKQFVQHDDDGYTIFTIWCTHKRAANLWFVNWDRLSVSCTYSIRIKMQKINEAHVIGQSDCRHIRWLMDAVSLFNGIFNKTFCLCCHTSSLPTLSGVYSLLVNGLFLCTSFFLLALFHDGR